MLDQRRQGANELLLYLRRYKLEDVVSENKQLADLLKSLYKRHHALLIWHVSLNDTEIWLGNRAKDEKFREYFKEATSDLCQSILVFSQGLYKPAYLILRSAIENFVKCVGIAEDQTVLSLTSVFELLSVVRDTPAVRSSMSMSRAFRRLSDIYSRLCNYVHSSNYEFMSLTTYLGVYPKFEETKAAEYVRFCRDVIVGMCGMLTLLLAGRFRELHHRDMDLIADILPKHVKRELFA